MNNAVPYDFGEAREAARRAASNQRQGEDNLREASAKLADAEKAYRIALARKIVEVHANGSAWTVAQDLARGDESVAELRYLRDVAKGVFEATQSAIWRYTADRKDCLELIEWSRRVAPDGQHEPTGFRDVSPRRAA